MAATLDSVINSIFQDSDSNSVLRRHSYRTTPNTRTTSALFMEIPINQDIIEVPAFAFDAFLDVNRQSLHTDMLVAELYSCGLSSGYKSLDAIMRDCLSTKFSKHLTKVSIFNAADTYYCTFGTIFNSNFKPLMMLSWILEKKSDGEDRIKYYYKRPILRINPGVCVSKEDAIQRFIVNKALVSSLNILVYTPYHSNTAFFLEQEAPFSHKSSWQVKVEIDECPFTIKKSEVPSISVTNKDLLQLALDHIDELLQR